MKMNKLLWLLLLLAGRYVAAQTTLIIEQIPATTPKSDSLYIAGSFNNWNAGDPKSMLRRQANGSYHFVFPAGSGTIEYKITRGSWTSGETFADGSHRSNRTFVQGSAPSISIQVAGWEDTHNPPRGQVMLLTSNFIMPTLGRSRRVWIYLPPDYSSNTKRRYPVIYMQDGQNLFENALSFAGEWGVDETMNQITAQTPDKSAIVVGIANGGSERINEYSPWTNSQYGGGQGEAYARFMVEHLKPFIDKYYRTQPEREHTFIAGSSMGALISFYTALQYQEVFGKAILFSPSFWFSPDIQTYLNNVPKKADIKFYLLAGTGEGPETANGVKTFGQALASKFGAEQVRLVTSEGGHNEAFWRREFPKAYIWAQEVPQPAPAPAPPAPPAPPAKPSKKK